MKFIKIFALSFLLILISCEDNPTIIDDKENDLYSALDYFPDKQGSVFKFKTDSLVITTSEFVNFAEREMLINGTILVKNTEYNILENTTTLNSLKGYFNYRKTDAAVYFQIVTNNFAESVLQLPDFLAETISFEIDEELNALSYPFDAGKNWDAFKLNAVVLTDSLPISLTITEIRAEIIGWENITLTINSDNYSEDAVKVGYEIIFRIPDFSDISDFESLINPDEISFNATVWYFRNLGIVKFEGSEIILNAITLGSFNLEDSTSVVREQLYEYFIP